MVRSQGGAFINPTGQREKGLLLLHQGALLKNVRRKAIFELPASMKRFLLIACSLFVLFAGAASAWANCKQISFAPDRQNRSSAGHTHGHHADSKHAHSHGAVIHCPTLDEFLTVATFSPGKDHRVQRTLDTLIAGLNSQSTPHHFLRLINGSPNFNSFGSIPGYLLLSVLRI